MGHFNIYQISTKPVDTDDYIEDMDLCDDELFKMRSDYGGDPVEDDAKAISGLRNELKDIADVDPRRRTITFKCKSTVRRVYARHIREQYRRLLSRLNEGVCDHYVFRRAIDDVCYCRHLFHNLYCMSPSSVVEDYLNGDLPRVLHIGAVLDAHY